MGQESIKEIIKNGLVEDEAHHKQWYLEEVLKALGFNILTIRMELKAGGFYAEEGIAP